jgi:hypothetical protein
MKIDPANIQSTTPVTESVTRTLWEELEDATDVIAIAKELEDLTK